ncbi:YkvA family protein [Clostridium sporogenes]|uniref:YkvA family protein n=1 Tax=Clostridium sporogenes TaxID=1509 RepID=UPI00223820A4|nr:DUF1232 domain-containing protein [Clostridium sporogenes]MCW6111378.1 DUF1232 domain-containing protein [Clostridium sporogenes]
MKVSSVKVTLTEVDIMTLIKDYLKVSGLHIESISLWDFIEVKGSYTKGISIPFFAKLALGSVDNNTLNIRIFKVKVMNLHIVDTIKKLALKLSLNSFKDYGIYVKKENIRIDLDILSKKIPYTYFKIEKINLYSGYIDVFVDNIVYSKENEKEDKEVEEEKFSLNKKYKPIYKRKDNYSLTRKSLKIKVPNKYNKFFEYSMLIPDITVLLYRLLKDKRVDMKTKTLVVSVLSYIVSPVDIIPSFIPFIGKIDDFAVVFFGLNKIIEEVPEEIILENWEGQGNIIFLVKQVIGYISNIIGTENVRTLMKFVNNIVGFIKEKSDGKSNLKAQKQEKDKAYEEVASVDEKSNNIH